MGRRSRCARTALPRGAGALAGCISLLAAALGIDYAQPVLAIQRDLEALRRRDARVTAWVILGGIVVWAPVGLLAGRAPRAAAAHLAELATFDAE